MNLPLANAADDVDRVGGSPDLARVLDLPRKHPTPGWAAEVLEAEFRRPGGTQRLRPLQAQALAELGEAGGLLALLPVGAGKTLVSLLAPQVLGCRRPLLLVPGKAARRAEREDVAHYGRHWIFPTPRVMSYEALARAGQADAIQLWAPDVIVADESHKLKSPHTAAAKRVWRYLLARGGEVPFVALTGSPTGRSLREISHLSFWALGGGSPLPVDEEEALRWARAVDASPPRGTKRLAPGALARLAPPGTPIPLPFGADEAAAVVGCRLRSTAGIVCSDVGFDGPIEMAELPLVCPPSLGAALDRLETAGELPDGTVVDSLRRPIVAMRLALGVWYRFEPPPPEEWIDARNGWFQAAAQLVECGRADTPDQAARLVARDPSLAASRELLLDWRRVRDDYDPDEHRVPDWSLDPEARVLRDVAARMDERTVAWVRSKAVGERLAEILGCGFFRQKGCDDRGRFAERIAGREPMVVSVGSGGEALNLQGARRSLVLEPPASGAIWEQLLGRTHRSGQTRTVEVLVPFSRPVHEKTLDNAVRSATFMERMTGQAQKLLRCLDKM